MKKRIALIAAAVGFAAFSVVSCGGNDEPSGSGNDYVWENLSGYRIEYNVKLKDPNVTEVADVLVEYLGSDGGTYKDTLKGSEWTKTVSIPLGKTIKYGLEARYFAKDDAVLTHDRYDFGIDLTSPFYNVYLDGPAVQMAKVTGHGYAGILNVEGAIEPNITRSKAYLMTSDGKEDVDSTNTYFCISVRTDGVKPDSLSKHVFVWK